MVRNREWSFTLKDDVYVRYKCFSTAAEFKGALVKKLPVKIDIGAVYNAPPSMRQSVSQFKPECKELVFDIDMTDYDPVRNCCDGAAICHQCWPLMTAALEVVHTALVDDFGFKHILWVYSGRRGIHCWVSDPRALALSQDARGAIVEYLSVKMQDRDKVAETGTSR
jgi:DNA primase small subunit